MECRIKKFSYAILINNIAYDLKGTCIDGHWDSHAKQGFCNKVRVANAWGEIKQNTLKAESFVVQEN